MRNITETLTPVGNRILVEVVGDNLNKKKGGIMLPDLVKYPQLECSVVRFDYKKLKPLLGDKILTLDKVLIGNMAGLELYDEVQPEKKYRLITPNDILLILE